MAAPKRKPQKAAPSQRLRLSQVTIENYKCLDKLTINLPAPSTKDELDVFALGSKNGVGKSSVLECCALSVVGAVFPNLLIRDTDEFRTGLDDFELLVRSGEKSAKIRADITLGDTTYPTEVALHKTGFKTARLGPLIEHYPPLHIGWGPFDKGHLRSTLLGLEERSLIAPPVLLFHSHRNVRHGPVMVEGMTEPSHNSHSSYLYYSLIDTFKVALVLALMARSGVFETPASNGDNEEVLTKLNGLMREFAGGTVDKLRRRADGGGLELRVAPVNGGHSFTFDGLSSGQKEIISTLFLIWFSTRNRPSIVLIDEPELHLNAEWQRIFVYQLAMLAPQNQYIFATHSEEIFGSVAAERRFILRPG